jgi:DNA-binding CsgD family transcriptional regulator
VCSTALAEKREKTVISSPRTAKDKTIKTTGANIFTKGAKDSGIPLLWVGPLSPQDVWALLDRGTHLLVFFWSLRCHIDFVLTDRELTIAKLLAVGKSEKEIVFLLKVRPATVSTHRLHIFQKLGINGIAPLVHWAIREGHVELMGKKE